MILDRAAAAAWSGRRVLLTGASGFLGGQVARQALAAGVELHTLGRGAGADGSAHYRVDLTDSAAVAGAVVAANPEAVIHCAAPGVAPGSVAYAMMLAVAEGGTEALYAACAALPMPPPVVHVGSGFELAAAPNSYGAAKAAATAVALRYAERLPLALLRPFHLYGAGEAPQRLGPYLIAQASKGQAIPLTGCAQVRDFLHVDDCAACLWQGLGLTGVYEIGSGRGLALKSYVETLLAELRGHGIVADCQFGALPYREGEPMSSLPEISAWTSACPRGARVSLIEGVADLVKAELARCP
jgi:UDP-glucose 4-epimerase